MSEAYWADGEVVDVNSTDVAYWDLHLADEGLPSEVLANPVLNYARLFEVARAQYRQENNIMHEPDARDISRWIDPDDLERTYPFIAFSVRIPWHQAVYESEHYDFSQESDPTFDAVYRPILNAALRVAIKRCELGPQQAKVLELSWGLGDAAAMSVADIACTQDITDERVREANAGALHRLRINMDTSFMDAA